MAPQTPASLASDGVRRRALAHLRRDPAMAAVIAQVGPFRMPPPRDGTHFQALYHSILYQQLSGKAAATIVGRMHELYGGRFASPNDVLATPDDALRGVGISRQKLGYLKDLARRSAGEWLDDIDGLDDQAVIDRLTTVKGIGVWTAQMFLMFRLRRPDVLPSLDLGIQKGVQRAYRLRTRPTPAKVDQIGARWRPYATVACWYLWRSLDGDANL
jgi:DNA-3-methyladenine glycosylase II